MRSFTHRLPVLLAAVLFLLAGCGSQSPPAVPPSSPSATPVFASDEEALAAAKDAYGKYLSASDKLAQGGWKDLSILGPFVRGAALENDKKAAATFSGKSLHQVGSTTFDTLSLQQLTVHGARKVAITAYLCIDVSSADIVDSNGNSVVPADRKTRVPLDVDFDDSDGGDLKVTRNDVWSGTSFC